MDQRRHVDATDGTQTALRPLAGGYSGETFLSGTGSERVVVRIYTRDPARAAVDASLLRLVRGLVPVPAVLELRHPTASTPAVVVTEYVEGVRLDQALGAVAGDAPPHLDYPALGRSLARVLNTLRGMPFLRPGTFADAELRLAPASLPADLADWAERLRAVGRLSTWASDDWAALLDLIDKAQDVIESAAAGPPRTVLVHSDFNPKNILIDPRTSTVVAVLDWEFAHAGSPFSDLGNLTRFERDERLVGPLLDELLDEPLDEPGDDRASDAATTHRQQLERGRAMDLWAVLELANRPAAHAVSELATRLLLAQARSADLSAWPWPASRVAPPRDAQL